MEPDAQAQALRDLVAANIRRLAGERDLSLSKLADFSGIARPALSRAISGKAAFTTDRLSKIAAALEVPVVKLFSESQTGPG